MKEFLYWFVRAIYIGILNLFPEVFDLNPEGNKTERRKNIRQEIHNVVDNFKECSQRME